MTSSKLPFGLPTWAARALTVSLCVCMLTAGFAGVTAVTDPRPASATAAATTTEPLPLSSEVTPSAPAPVKPVEVQPRTKLPKDFKPNPKTEVVSARSARTSIYVLGDGTHVMASNAHPVHYQDLMGGWLPINNSIVADKEQPGVLRSRANAWTARFAPLSSGVSLESGGGVQTMKPMKAADVSPVQGPGANQVTYPDVWPNADLVYTVNSDSVEEEIVLHGTPDRSSFDFSTGTDSYVGDPTTPGGLKARGERAGEAHFIAPVVKAKDGSPARDAKPELVPALDGSPVVGGVEFFV
jgi:hypothetical protein